MLNQDHVVAICIPEYEHSYLEKFQHDIEEIEFLLLRQVKSNRIVTPDRVDIAGITDILSGCGNFGQQIINRSRKINIDRAREIQKLQQDILVLENAIASRRNEQVRASEERASRRERLARLGAAYTDIVENNDLTILDKCVELLSDREVSNKFVSKCRGRLPDRSWTDKAREAAAKMQGRYTTRQNAEFVYHRFVKALTFVLDHCRDSTIVSQASRYWESSMSSSVLTSSLKEEDISSVVVRLLNTHEPSEMVAVPAAFCRYLKSIITTQVTQSSSSSGESQSFEQDLAILREMLVQAQNNARWERSLCDFSQYKFTQDNLADLYHMHRSLDVNDVADFLASSVALFTQHIPQDRYKSIKSYIASVAAKERNLSYQDAVTMICAQLGE